MLLLVGTSSLAVLAIYITHKLATTIFFQLKITSQKPVQHVFWDGPHEFQKVQERHVWIWDRWFAQMSIIWRILTVFPGPLDYLKIFVTENPENLICVEIAEPFPVNGFRLAFDEDGVKSKWFQLSFKDGGNRLCAKQVSPSLGS